MKHEYMRIGRKYLITPRRWWQLWRRGFTKHKTNGCGKWRKVWLRELGQ